MPGGDRCVPDASPWIFSITAPRNPRCPCPRSWAAPSMPWQSLGQHRGSRALPLLSSGVPKSRLILVFRQGLLPPWAVLPLCGLLGGLAGSSTGRARGEGGGSEQGGLCCRILVSAPGELWGVCHSQNPRGLGAVWGAGLGEGRQGGLGWQSLSRSRFPGICQRCSRA